MKEVEALAFDVGGTVFDWQTPIRAAVKSLARERGAEVDDRQFALAWRAGMFGVLKQVREGTLPWMNADQMHRRVLDDLAEKYSRLDLSTQDRDELNRIWHRLKAWPDLPGALARLRERYKAIVLTVLSWAIAVPIGFLIGHPFMRALGSVFDFPGQYFFSFQGVWIWFIIVSILSLAASWLPARRATRVSVNQSLAYE